MGTLTGTRVLALEQYGAGPFATLQLAQLGAEVIKIEDPSQGGDVGRYVPPYQSGDSSLFFEALNRDKSSIALDLQSAAGRQVFEELAAHSDVIFSNLRGDVPEKLRIRYDDVRHLNPRLVCCSLSGFGMTGPRRAEPGYDYVIQALAGWMSVTGDPAGPPTKSGLSVVDFAGGLAAVSAVTAGLLAARRDGVGLDCDVSLFDTAIGLLTYIATWSLTADYRPERLADSAHPSLVPFQLFAAADGHIVIACAKQKFFVRLTEAIDRPELADDPRFADFGSRHEHAELLVAAIGDAIRARSVAEWAQRLAAFGVPAGVVQNVAQALRDPQTQARGLIVDTDSPVFGSIRGVAAPVRLGLADTVRRHAPDLGGDRDAILRDVLCRTPEQIAALAADGAFG